jgi:hypothetical protein
MRTLSVVDVALVLLAGPCTGRDLATDTQPSATALDLGPAVGCTYHTIADANPGDVIKVKNTVFTESPVLSKDLALAAAKLDDLATPARGAAYTTLALMSCPLCVRDRCSR